MGSGDPGDSAHAYDNHHCLEDAVMAIITMENLKYLDLRGQTIWH